MLLKATDQLFLQAYSDSNWVACPFCRRSVISYVNHLGTSPVSWKSKKRITASKSSSEAEYKAMSQALAELTRLVRLLEELGVTSLRLVTLYCDNLLFT